MKKIKLMYVVLYFVLNVLATYLVTSSYLNPNIVSFELPIANYLFSIIGNLAILLFLLLIGMFFIRKERNLFKYIIIVTLFLNFFIFLVGYFTRNFKAMLSFHNLTLFRNPNAGFAYQIVLDGLNEMVNSWQLLGFLPFVILLLIYFIVRRKVVDKSKLRIKLLFSLLIISLISSFTSSIYFKEDVSKNWPFRSEYALYGVSSCGIYNYYFLELVIGADYTEDYYERIKEVDDNLSSYNNDDEDAAVFKEMNLFVIQAEALNGFVIDLQYDGEIITPYLNSLLEDENVFYFSNVHSVVGMGNTSDAEFAFNTGYYPLGDLTIYWEAYDKLFDIQSLPLMFDTYQSYAYNPTIEGFYAHKFIFENLYKFKSFKGFESHNKIYPTNLYKELYLHKKWVSDQAMLNFSLKEAKTILEEGNNFYVFSQTISPHYPFVSLDYYERFDNYQFKKLDKKFRNYLNQIHYIDKVLYDFLMLGEEELKDTVFLIYGDHGNTLPKEGFEEVLNKSLTDLEYRKLLLEIPVIFYDPSGKLTEYISTNELMIDYDRVLSQIDLFSTVKSLYSLVGNEHLLGVNMFSSDKSFSIEPKGLDIITDDFFYSLKNNQYELYNDISYQKMIIDVLKIKDFKLSNDNYLTKKINE